MVRHEVGVARDLAPSRFANLARSDVIRPAFICARVASLERQRGRVVGLPEMSIDEGREVRLAVFLRVMEVVRPDRQRPKLASWAETMK